jgi:uncharacterized protein
MNGPPPQSPCIRLCTMDVQDRYCLGCARTRAEIASWWGMPDAEKRQVLAALPARRAAAPMSDVTSDAGNERNRAAADERRDQRDD